MGAGAVESSRFAFKPALLSLVSDIRISWILGLEHPRITSPTHHTVFLALPSRSSDCIFFDTPCSHYETPYTSLHASAMHTKNLIL